MKVRIYKSCTANFHLYKTFQNSFPSITAPKQTCNGKNYHPYHTDVKTESVHNPFVKFSNNHLGENAAPVCFLHHIADISKSLWSTHIKEQRHLPRAFRTQQGSVTFCPICLCLFIILFINPSCFSDCITMDSLVRKCILLFFSSEYFMSLENWKAFCKWMFWQTVGWRLPNQRNWGL